MKGTRNVPVKGFALRASSRGLDNEETPSPTVFAFRSFVLTREPIAIFLLLRQIPLQVLNCEAFGRNKKQPERVCISEHVEGDLDPPWVLGDHHDLGDCGDFSIRLPY